jgi:hypothetical protein
VGFPRFTPLYVMFSPLPTAMMRLSPQTTHATVNHVVAVGPAGPVHSRPSVDLFHNEDQFQAGNSPAQDAIPADAAPRFSTNVLWEREPSVEQDNTSVWAQDVRKEEPCVDVLAASSPSPAEPSNSSAEPAVDGDVPMQDNASHPPRRVRLHRVSKRFHVPAVVPDGGAARAHLIRVFREDIIEGQMRRMLLRSKIQFGQLQVSRHNIRQLQLTTALKNDGYVNGKLYPLPENITRPDWNRRTGECLYSVGLVHPSVRMSVEQLEAELSGAPYRLWEYWRSRAHIRSVHVHRYVFGSFGRFGFYRFIMWFWLEKTSGSTSGEFCKPRDESESDGVRCCDRAPSTMTRLFLSIEYNLPLSLSISTDRL